MKNLRPEFALIDWIRQSANKTLSQSLLSQYVDTGIGDDCAVLKNLLPQNSLPDNALPESAEQPLLVTTDMLMEGVHFRTNDTCLNRIGRKILGVNLSDIAAMAGTPTCAFLSLAVPRTMAEAEIKTLLTGIFEMAEQFDVAIAGGDTNAWDGGLVVNITLLGAAPEGGAVLRSGAKVGDAICVTGTLGGSILEKHLDFTPRVEEARLINSQCDLHAMIDISDGLLADLSHILEASNVGAILETESIPISDAAIQHSRNNSHADSQNEKTPLDHALADGEDFELLFTLPEEHVATLQKELPAISITKIGTITAEKECILQFGNGDTQTLTPQDSTGWVHQITKEI